MSDFDRRTMSVKVKRSKSFLPIISLKIVAESRDISYNVA